MKPWFIREDNVVPFPKKDKGVVRLPNVNAYPDFLSGVQDLQNHLKQGDISSDIHKKLYQDLIHRFMKTESFETPWFLREAPATDVDAETKKKLEQWFKKYAPYHTLEGKSMLDFLITHISLVDLDEERMDPLMDSCVYAPEFLNLLQRTNPDKDKTLLKKLWFERKNISWNAADAWKALKKVPTAGFLPQAMQGQYKEIDFNPPAKFLGNREDAPITNACVDELMNILRINDLHYTKIDILFDMMKLPHIQSILKTGTVNMSKAKQPVLNSKTYDITNTNVVQTEGFETPWFFREQLIQEYRTSTEYKGYKIEIHRTNIKPPYVATITSQSTKRELQRQGGENESEALKNAQDSIDSMEAQAPTVSSDSTTSILFNTLASGELLKDPSIYNDIYAKIDQGEAGPILVIGNETYGADALSKAGFKKSADRRPVKQKTNSEESMPQVMFPFSGSDLKNAGIKVNGRYVMDIDGEYQDEYQHTVYPLTFVGTTIHSRDTLRMSKPGFTVGTKRNEDVERPWFLREAPADAGITGLGVSQQPAITPNQGGISSLSPIGKDRAQKLNRIVNKLKADPEFIDQIFDQLSAKTKDVEGQFVNRFIQMLDPKLTNPEEDQTFGGFLKSFAEIIAEIPGSNEEKFQFVNTLGKVSHIDISKLLQPTANWDSWLVGTPFSKKLFEQCFNDPRLRTNLKGPGEAALAILSPSIKLMTEAGDIEINKQKVEVKGGESAKGGRLTPTKNVVGQVDAAWIRKNIFNNNKKAVVPNNTSHLNFVETLVKPNNMSAEQIERLLLSIFLQPALKKEIAKISKKTLNITSQDLFKLGLLNYSYSQNDNNFLILTRDVRKSIYFSINDWERAYQNIAISFAITGSDSRSTGIPQLGVKSKTV